MPVYLKYGDIKGEVTESAHPGWIELTSAQFGGIKRGSPSGGAERERASPNVSEIVATKDGDSASVALFRESLSGKAVPAIIDFVREDGTVRLRVSMSGAMIGSYNISGSGPNPTETITLNFNGMTFTQDPGSPP